MAGLIQKNDVAAELRPARIRRDFDDLQKVMKHIQECNPFEIDEDVESFKGKQFNIHIGKSASHDVCESLMNIPLNGQIRHQCF